MPENLPKKDILAYGILAMPLSFAGIPLYIHAPDFYATQYGVPLTSLGFILLFLRFFDAIQDPLIGYYSDRFSRYRHIFMPAAALALLIGFALLFKPVTGSYLLLFTLCIVVATTSFSILTINLNSLGGVWSEDKNQKTTIASYREAFGVVGLILAVILPNILQIYLSKQQAFLYLSILLALIMVVAIAFFTKWYQGHKNLNSVKQSGDFSSESIADISVGARNFFFVYGVSVLASSIPAVLVLFFIRDRLDLENYAGIFLLAYFLSGALGISIWNKLSRNIGKNQAWLVSMMLAVASFVWAYFLNIGDFWQYLIICIISGVAFGAELVLPSSILADYIQNDNKESNATLYYGILTFLMKFSLAISAAIVFPYLEYSGFIAGQENTSPAMHSLSICYAAMPCLIKLISIYLLWRIINAENSNNVNRSNYSA